MTIERKPRAPEPPPDYPSRAEYKRDRRRFLGELGLVVAGALVAPAVARASTPPKPDEPVTPEEPAEPVEPLPGDIAPPDPEPDPDEKPPEEKPKGPPA